MSAAHTFPFSTKPFQFGEHQPERRSAPERRRTSPQQGRALELLGHAIEYLVDSRLFDQWESPADAAAVQLLMECSRAVFANCEKIVPWHQRVQQAWSKKMHERTASGR